MRVSYLILCLVFAGLLTAADPKFGSQTVAAGAGAAFAAGGTLTTGYPAGPSFSGEYEFGLHRFVAATIGVQNHLTNVDQCSRWGCTAFRQRITLMPFGIRGIIPLANGRAEAFVGTGGARMWTTSDPLAFFGDKLLWHANAGLRFALDRQGRFRLGPVVRLNRDLGRPAQSWVSLTGEFSYRFGR